MEIVVRMPLPPGASKYEVYDAAGSICKPAQGRADAGDLKTIDCYVMGSRTYETALSFDSKGLGWAYGDKPVFVLTSRELPRTRDTVELYSGDLAQFVNERLRPGFRSIWFVGVSPRADEGGS
jgi:hypothetical protein